jgi:hypothetical protein
VFLWCRAVLDFVNRRLANFRGHQRERRLVTVLKGEIKPLVDSDSTRSLFSTASAFLRSELRRTSNSIT